MYFHEEIRKIFSWYPLLSGAMVCPIKRFNFTLLFLFSSCISSSSIIALMVASSVFSPEALLSAINCFLRARRSFSRSCWDFFEPPNSSSSTVSRYYPKWIHLKGSISLKIRHFLSKKGLSYWFLVLIQMWHLIACKISVSIFEVDKKWKKKSFLFLYN